MQVLSIIVLYVLTFAISYATALCVAYLFGRLVLRRRMHRPVKNPPICYEFPGRKK